MAWEPSARTEAAEAPVAALVFFVFFVWVSDEDVDDLEISSCII